MRKSVSYSLLNDTQHFQDIEEDDDDGRQGDLIHGCDFPRSEGSIYSYYENDQEFEMLVKTYLRDMKYTSLNQAALNIFYAMINGGLVALPFVAQESGIPLFIVGITVIAILSGYTSIMVISMASEQRVRTLEDLAECAYGKRGFYIASVLQIILSFSMMCISLNVWADILSDVFSELSFSADNYMLATHTGQCLIGGVVILPLCLWKRNMAKLSWTSSITVLCVLAAIFAIIATYLTDARVSHTIFSSQNFSEVTRIKSQWWALVFIGVYGYSYNQKVLTIYSSLRRRTSRRWQSAVQRSTVGISILYVLFGLLGYVSKQRKHIRLDSLNFFLDNADEESNVFDPARAMVAFSLLMTLPVDCLIAVTTWRRLYAKWCRPSAASGAGGVGGGIGRGMSREEVSTKAVTRRNAEGKIQIISNTPTNSSTNTNSNNSNSSYVSDTTDHTHSNSYYSSQSYSEGIRLSYTTNTTISNNNNNNNNNTVSNNYTNDNNSDKRKHMHRYSQESPSSYTNYNNNNNNNNNNNTSSDNNNNNDNNSNTNDNNNNNAVLSALSLSLSPTTINTINTNNTNNTTLSSPFPTLHTNNNNNNNNNTTNKIISSSSSSTADVETATTNTTTTVVENKEEEEEEQPKYRTILHSCEDNIRSTLVEHLLSPDDLLDEDSLLLSLPASLLPSSPEHSPPTTTAVPTPATTSAHSLCTSGEVLPTLVLWFLVVILSTIVNHWLYWAGSLCTWSNAGLMFLGPAMLYFKLGLASDYCVSPWRVWGVSWLPNRVYMTTIKALGYAILLFNLAVIMCMAWNGQFEVINHT